MRGFGVPLFGAVQTIAQAHARGVFFRLVGEPGGGWSLTIDALHVGGDLHTVCQQSLSQAITDASRWIHEHAHGWAVIHPRAEGSVKT